MNIINNCNPVLINTRKYFNYLFNSGYLIKKYSFKQTGMILWRVLLEGPNCLIQISQDRREILLSFSPKNALREEGYNFWLNDQICIQPMIFYLTKGEKAVCLYDDSFYKKTKLQFFSYLN